MFSPLVGVTSNQYLLQNIKKKFYYFANIIEYKAIEVFF